jgi:hypothetical protein
MARIGLLAALVIAGLGCGGSDPCGDSKCPNEPKKTQAQYTQCVNQHEANKNAKCNAEFSAYERCSKGAELCKSDGTIDGSATSTKISNDCKLEGNAYLCCTTTLFCPK